MDTNDTITEAVAVATGATSSKGGNKADSTFLEYATSSKVHKNKQKPRSRLGCISCKKSKVKCDEKQPTCSRCSKSGRDCVYPVKISIKKPLDGSLNEDTGIKYYGVVASYSDIPVSEQTKDYVIKTNEAKSISFVKHLINNVNTCQVEYKNFDDVMKAGQN